MQLRKFYGRTVSNALALVKRDLGVEALILETRLLGPEDPAARLNPGARYEILAARDPRSVARNPARQESKPVMNAENGTYAKQPAQAPELPPDRRNNELRLKAGHPNSQDLLEDLGMLRAQINQLLEGDLAGRAADPAHADVSDYHALIELGVDHGVLAPHFRAWLDWRTANPSHRAWIGRLHGGAAARMKGESLREWLWLAWSERQEMRNAECGMRNEESKIVALVGPTGSGKTTTLAKLASINRQQKRQKAVVLTLDTFRFGATEQWRRMSRLMGIEVEEIVSQADIGKSMERWGEYDWVGIDTPGGLTPESAAGILYGSILARCPHLETILVLPATQQDAISREQLKRYGALGARQVLFSRMDESVRHGGIVNLTMDGKWRIDSFATGCRIPEDWEPANRESLWRRVLAPPALAGGMAA